MKQIFKALESMNSLAEITNEAEHYIVIYVNDHKEYEGSSYKEYCDYCKEEFIPSYAEYLMTLLFTHNQGKFWDEFGNENKIEFYIYCK